MRWAWRSVLLVVVLSICVVILIAPEIDLQETALRALQWMQLFFLLITGLIAVLFYLPAICEPLFTSQTLQIQPLAPSPDLFSLRC
ncbi:MAG: hypothetical protein ACJ71N_00335 [Terriglobales bacterium]|jgi:hypothetical protein